MLALVVDDSMLIRHTVCRFLEERGFDVEVATNGAEALQLLGGVRPDIIITDLDMPRMSGGELISVLKKERETAGIPIIVVAGRRTASGMIPEPMANFIIYKNIDLQTQLDKALSAVIGSEAQAV